MVAAAARRTSCSEPGASYEFFIAAMAQLALTQVNAGESSVALIVNISVVMPILNHDSVKGSDLANDWSDLQSPALLARESQP
jgi:hypothetical protein